MENQDDSLALNDIKEVLEYITIYSKKNKYNGEKKETGADSS